MPAATAPADAAELQALLLALRAAVAQPGEQTPQLATLAWARLAPLDQPGPDAPCVIDCLLTLTQLHYIATLADAAAAPLQAALGLAQRCGDAARLRRVHTFRGVMEMEVGNLPAATTALVEALRVAEALPDPAEASPVWCNLGLALQRWSLNAEALRCYGRARDLSAQAPAFASVYRSVLSNMANCGLHQEDLTQALNAAHEAIAMNPAPADATALMSRAIAEADLARLLLRRGEFEAAERHNSHSMHFAAAVKSARAELLAALGRGLLAVYRGQGEAALVDMKRALEIARRDVPSKVRETLAACVEAYRQAGQHDVALIYLHELLAMNHQARADQLLLLQYQHLRRLQQHELDAALAPRSGDAALQPQQAQLRGGLGQREQVRNRMLLLEQQSVAAELHDDVTGRHCYRVGRLAALLGEAIGLESDVCFLIDLAARLHDIGKLVVPEAILLKPGKLTAGEFAIMQTHTTAGADILARAGVPQMHIAEEIARHHHERWDGRGYPAGLARDRIPIAARVTALADVFDALTHPRPYKTAWTVDAALAEIQRLRGQQFDPELTDVFLRLVPQLQQAVGDLDAYLGQEASHSPFVQAREEFRQALVAQLGG